VHDRVADSIARCLAGDKAAYRHVVTAYGDQLVGVLRPLLGSLEDARDVAQETFVRAYVNLQRYDRSRPFRPWLFRIGRNLAYNHLNARRRRPEGQLHDRGATVLGGLESETKSPMHAVVEGERRTAIDEVLALMRPQYREVLVLRYMAKLEYEQIATTMDVPVGTVKTWLNRAKSRFRELARGKEIL